MCNCVSRCTSVVGSVNHNKERKKEKKKNILLKFLQWAHNDTFRGIHLSLWLASLFIAVATQCRILSIIRHHQRQIQQLHAMSSTRQMQIKLAINIASIIPIYCAFNLPVLVVTTSHQIVKRHIELSYNVYSWAETVAFMTLTVNPLVCFLRVKTIRNAITESLPRLRTMEKKFGGLPFNNQVLLYGCFSQGLGTTKSTNLIGWNRY